MKKYIWLLCGLTTLIFSGCTSTFFGSVFILSFRDIIDYVAIALIFAVIIGLNGKSGSKRRLFWIWFILSLILTPLAGLIYLLVEITKERE